MIPCLAEEMAPFIRDRAGGAYYQASFAGAAASAPDMLIITSYNEWPEGSNIEPSVEFGRTYLDLTAQLSAAFKNGSIACLPRHRHKHLRQQRKPRLMPSRSSNHLQPQTAPRIPVLTPAPSDTALPISTPTDTPTATTTASPVASPTAQPEGQIIYTVQAGDTLSLIADRFDVNLDELYTYNALTVDSIIQIGQQLLLGYSILPDGSVPLEGFPSARIEPDGTIIHTVEGGNSFYCDRRHIQPDSGAVFRDERPG